MTNPETLQYINQQIEQQVRKQLREQSQKPKVNTMEIPDFMTTCLNGTVVGDKVQLIVSYDVIEKTKSYTLLKINSVYKISTARIY